MLLSSRCRSHGHRARRYRSGRPAAAPGRRPLTTASLRLRARAGHRGRRCRHLGWRRAIRQRRKHRGQPKAGPHAGPPPVPQIATRGFDAGATSSPTAGSLSRSLLSALPGSPGGVGPETLAGTKAGGSPRAHGAASQHPGSGAAADADALAIGHKAVTLGTEDRHTPACAGRSRSACCAARSHE